MQWRAEPSRSIQFYGSMIVHLSKSGARKGGQVFSNYSKVQVFFDVQILIKIIHYFVFIWITRNFTVRSGDICQIAMWALFWSITRNWGLPVTIFRSNIVLFVRYLILLRFGYSWFFTLFRPIFFIFPDGRLANQIIAEKVCGGASPRGASPWAK
jgi:hypothetical protein